MLDAYIIDKIRRQEQEKQRRDDRVQPRIEPPSRFPLQRPPHWDREEQRDRRRSEDEDSSGIIVLDM